jgi:hypothetical protein
MIFYKMKIDLTTGGGMAVQYLMPPIFITLFCTSDASHHTREVCLPVVGTTGTRMMRSAALTHGNWGRSTWGGGGCAIHSTIASTH